MVVAEEVEKPVDEEPLGLARERRPALRSLAPRGVERDDDVAEEPVGRAARPLALREGEDVGRAVAATPAPVQRPHLAVGDEDERELRGGQPDRVEETSGGPAEARGERGRVPAAGRDDDRHRPQPFARPGSPCTVAEASGSPRQRQPGDHN